MRCQSHVPSDSVNCLISEEFFEGRNLAFCQLPRGSTLTLLVVRVAGRVCGDLLVLRSHPCLQRKAGCGHGRILSSHCGAQAFGDYACDCQICCAAINENELFSLDCLRQLSHAELC